MFLPLIWFCIWIFRFMHRDCSWKSSPLLFNLFYFNFAFVFVLDVTCFCEFEHSFLVMMRLKVQTLVAMALLLLIGLKHSLWLMRKLLNVGNLHKLWVQSRCVISVMRGCWFLSFKNMLVQINSGTCKNSLFSLCQIENFSIIDVSELFSWFFVLYLLLICIHLYIYR